VLFAFGIAFSAGFAMRFWQVMPLVAHQLFDRHARRLMFWRAPEAG
jgi:hypothetical protein